MTDKSNAKNSKMTSLKPIVKWSGGKKDELKKIIPHLPEQLRME